MLKRLAVTGLIALLAVFLAPLSAGAQTELEQSADSNIEEWVLVPPDGPPSDNCLQFENGHFVCDQFLEMWQSRGLDMGDPGVSFRESLALFGMPWTQTFQQNGLAVQYWERSVAELHTDVTGDWGPILLRRLGADLENQLPQEFRDFRVPDNTCEGRYFPETTGCIQPDFLEFWENNGGIQVFGFPLNDATTLDTPNGTFKSQWFERHVIEHHPENAGTPYEYLLRRLGAESLETGVCSEGKIEPGQIVEVLPCQIVKGEAEVSVSPEGPFLVLYDDDPTTGHLLSCPEGCFVKAPWGAGLSAQSLETLEAELKTDGCVDQAGCAEVLTTVWIPGDQPTTNKCEFSIPKEESRLVPAGCFVSGDVRIRNEIGEFVNWYDDDEDTALLVIINKDVEVNAPHGASVAPLVNQDGSDAVAQAADEIRERGQFPVIKIYPS